MPCYTGVNKCPTGCGHALLLLRIVDTNRIILWCSSCDGIFACPAENEVDIRPELFGGLERDGMSEVAVATAEEIQTLGAGRIVDPHVSDWGLPDPALRFSRMSEFGNRKHEMVHGLKFAVVAGKAMITVLLLGAIVVLLLWVVLINLSR